MLPGFTIADRENVLPVHFTDPRHLHADYVPKVPYAHDIVRAKARAAVFFSATIATIILGVVCILPHCYPFKIFGPIVPLVAVFVVNENASLGLLVVNKGLGDKAMNDPVGPLSFPKEGDHRIATSGCVARHQRSPVATRAPRPAFDHSFIADSVIRKSSDIGVLHEDQRIHQGTIKQERRSNATNL